MWVWDGGAFARWGLCECECGRVVDVREGGLGWWRWSECMVGWGCGYVGLVCEVFVRGVCLGCVSRVCVWGV